MQPFLQRKIAVLVVVVLLLAVSSTAFAALRGDPLKLGLANTINLATSLSGRVSTAMFAVYTSHTTSQASAILASNSGGGPALDLRVMAGKAPLRVNATGNVVNLNTDLLDGKASSDFIQARGEALRAATEVNEQTYPDYLSLIYTTSPDLLVGFSCADDPRNLRLYNTGSELLNVFIDDGEPNPVYIQLNPGQDWYEETPSTDHVMIQVQGSQVATIEVSYTQISKPLDDRPYKRYCQAQGQALVTR